MERQPPQLRFNEEDASVTIILFDGIEKGPFFSKNKAWDILVDLANKPRNCIRPEMTVPEFISMRDEIHRTHFLPEEETLNQKRKRMGKKLFATPDHDLVGTAIKGEVLYLYVRHANAKCINLIPLDLKDEVKIEVRKKITILPAQ